MRSGDPHLKIYHSEETLKTPRQHKTQQNKKLRLATTMCWDHYFLRPNIFSTILIIKIVLKNTILNNYYSILYFLFFLIFFVMKLSKGISTLLNVLNIISLFQTGINQ